MEGVNNTSSIENPVVVDDIVLKSETTTVVENINIETAPIVEEINLGSNKEINHDKNEMDDKTSSESVKIPENEADGNFVFLEHSEPLDTKSSSEGPTLKKSRIDFQSLPTRAYLDQTVVPILLQALSTLAKERCLQTRVAMSHPISGRLLQFFSLHAGISLLQN
ncbi:uncharacterized protein LOC135923788 isoform X3 [Gordionus sp. m RMFG-2023]|uniref:uncharacterized protein LOC135923788 isoform X3 n=1 Tax=Gordionus sp. m RMFG-2023 TaxID=3053472 RepID=UPI0031FD15B4